MFMIRTLNSVIGKLDDHRKAYSDHRAMLADTRLGDYDSLAADLELLAAVIGDLALTVEDFTTGKLTAELPSTFPDQDVTDEPAKDVTAPTMGFAA